MLPRNHPDRIQITFDDRRLVANAGLLLPATLARHLGLPELLRQRLDLGYAPGRANTSDKMMTLVASALAGGDCIDDADVLRTGGTACTLGGTVKAPSTLGTFLRSFRWGHVRQLDRVSRELLARAWQAGAGPGDGPLNIDLDSTICETYGLAKEGARHHGYTGKRGYHPLLAIAAGTGDVLMSRLREGRANTARGAAHFLRETVGRVRYAGANGRLTLRADSGFYTHGVVSVCRKMDVRFSITIRQHKSLHNLIEAIPEDAWTPIPYWMDSAADVAETTCTPFQAEADAAPVRLIVRRVKPTPGSQLALFAKYSYHGFITDRDGELLELEADHRRHAEIENAIRDLKYGVGLNHLPSGRFAANGAWLAVQTMAHNLARWTARIGLGERIATTKTLRRRFFSLAGRLTRSARRLTLHFPDRWPWAEKFSRALARLRAIPTPGLTAPSATDPPTGQPKIPADSCQPGPREFPAAYSLAIPRIAAPADGHRGPCAAMKTVRPPPYPKWNTGYFPCSSLTPLPLSSRRPSVSFGGFGLTGQGKCQFMKGLTLTQKEQARLQVLNGILEGQISVDEAAEVLGVSERHVWRILAEYRKEGAAALAHGNRGRRANNSIPEEARTQVVALARTRYARVNHTHLTELLAEREEIVLGRSTVRRILVGAGMASPRRRRPPLHRVRRQRMSQEGMLVQVDGSVHAWLEERGPRCTVLLAIDDATSTVPYALFRHEEDTHGYFLLMQELIRRCGVPLALYSDRHAVFKYVPGSHQSPAPTQFGRAMAELGVEQIFARSPEAKGRVERANGTFQDRLVTELRLAGARTISEANQVLWAFLTRFNKRFGVPPAQSTNAYRSPDPDLNLAGILCFKHSRKVARDNTVKYNWHTLQLLPSSERSTYVGAHVVVQERLDGKLVVCYQNQIVPTQEAPPRPGVLRTLNATRGLGSVTVENLAAGMDTNGIGGHERERLGAMTAIGRGLAAGRLTTDRESEAVHPKAQPPRPPTPRQRARWKAVQRAKRRGLSLRAIARELGISRITVRKYVEASSPPVYPDRELAAHS